MNPSRVNRREREACASSRDLVIGSHQAAPNNARASALRTELDGAFSRVQTGDKRLDHGWVEATGPGLVSGNSPTVNCNLSFRKAHLLVGAGEIDLNRLPNKSTAVYHLIRSQTNSK